MGGMYGCGCKEVIDFLILLIPTPLVFALFAASLFNLKFEQTQKNGFKNMRCVPSCNSKTIHQRHIQVVGIACMRCLASERQQNSPHGKPQVPQYHKT